MDEISTMIEGMRKQGYADEQIRQVLLQTGWSPEEVDLIIPPAEAPAAPVSVENLTTPPGAATAPPQTTERVPAPTATEPYPSPETPGQINQTGSAAAPESVREDAVPQPIESDTRSNTMAPGRKGVPVKQLILLGGGFFLIFLVTAGILLLVLSRFQKTPKEEAPQQQQQAVAEQAPPDKSQPVATASALVLYTRTQSAASSSFLAYAFDLTTGNREDLTPRLLGGKEGVIRLCRFSPDGTQAPLLSYDAKLTAATISAFFSDTLQLQPRASLSNRPDRNSLLTRYGTTCRWLDGETVLIGREPGQSTASAQTASSVERRVVLTRDNTIEEATVPAALANTAIYRFGPVRYVVPEDGAVDKKRGLQRQTAAFDLGVDEYPVGFVEEVFYTVQPSEATPSAYEFIPYTGNSLTPGTPVPYMPPEGYSLIAAAPVPNAQTFLLRLDKTAAAGSLVASRYELLDTKTGQTRSVGTFTGYSTTPFMPGSVPFRVTSDGAWVVSPAYAAAADGRTNEVSVRAWNIENGSEVVICEKFCRAYEAFTPGQPIQE